MRSTLMRCTLISLHRPFSGEPPLKGLTTLHIEMIYYLKGTSTFHHDVSISLPGLSWHDSVQNVCLSQPTTIGSGLGIVSTLYQCFCKFCLRSTVLSYPTLILFLRLTQSRPNICQ